MKFSPCVTAIAGAVLAAGAGISATLPDSTRVQAQMVLTVLPGAGGSRPQNLQAGDVKVLEDNTPLRVTELARMPGDLSDVQLFILLDDSTRSSSLGTHLPELKKFIESLPAATQVAIGYMRNGTVGLSQSFTVDHQQAARKLRLPDAIPGVNGSPYFSLGDLAQRWPSAQSAGRRAVLMLTDGVDRYYDTSTVDDPYVNAAIRNALKHGIMVYSIYLRGAGLYGRGSWVRDFAQSRLMQVTEETGGYAYFEEFSDPVDIAPFLKDLQDRLENQYLASIEALNEKGLQTVKLRTETPGLKIVGPTRIYLP